MGIHLKLYIHSRIYNTFQRRFSLLTLGSNLGSPTLTLALAARHYIAVVLSFLFNNSTMYM